MNWLSTIFNKSQSKQPTVVWIHGANQSSLSFSYLRLKCQFKNEILINYSSSNKFYDNLEKIKTDIKDQDSIFIIGHSLGGIYGLHLVEHFNVIGGISLATPFKGSSTADWAKYIVPNYQLFKDVGRKSKPIVDTFDIKLTIPWTQIVSTAGSVPYHSGPNDGVVTIESMTVRDDMEKIEVPYTHYEVVCNDQVAEIVKDRYYRLTN